MWSPVGFGGQVCQTKQHGPGGLHETHVFLRVLEAGSPRSGVSRAGSSEAALPGLQVAALLLPVHVILPLYVQPSVSL